MKILPLRRGECNDPVRSFNDPVRSFNIACQQLQLSLAGTTFAVFVFKFRNKDGLSRTDTHRNDRLDQYLVISIDEWTCLAVFHPESAQIRLQKSDLSLESAILDATPSWMWRHNGSGHVTRPEFHKFERSGSLESVWLGLPNDEHRFGQNNGKSTDEQLNFPRNSSGLSDGSTVIPSKSTELIPSHKQSPEKSLGIPQ